MCPDFSLNGKKIADFACGSGHNSLALLERFQDAKTEGFDISSAACLAYRNLVKNPSHELDLTSGNRGDGSFDAGIIIGGLHHCVSDLPTTINTIESFLKPHSPLFIFEPSRDFILQAVRNLWYRCDKYFDAQTEEALSHKTLAKLASSQFNVELVRHMGGPGYFFILNSLIFRIPYFLKHNMTPPLMLLDSAYNKLKWRPLYPYFIARWRKKS